MKIEMDRNVLASLKGLFGAMALSGLLSAAAGGAAAEPPVTRTQEAAGGVISIGGAITEIVYALGAGSRLVAVDSTSLYPPEATDLPNVGYMRRLAAEPLLALNPSLVLAVEDSGPPSVLDQLREAGAHLIVVPDEPTPAGVLEKIRIVANALGFEAEGKAMARRLQEDFSRWQGRLAGIESRPKVLFLLSVGKGAPLAAGRETSAGAIIELAGGRNAIGVFEGFKPISPEAAAGAAPDVLLVTDRTLQLLGGLDVLLKRPEIAMTPAGRNGRVITMDALLLLGFGPRTPIAIRKLAAALHPEGPQPAGPSE